MTDVLKLIGPLWILVCAPSAHAIAGERCSFADLDLDAAVDALLSKMPQQWTAPDADFRPTLIPGVEIGGIRVTGFEILQRYGPISPYCINGTRLFHVDLVNSGGGIQVTSPWKYSCSDHSGTIGLAAGFTRITVPFRVDGVGSGAKLAYEGPSTPVAVEGIHLRLTGAGSELEKTADLIGKLAPAFQRQEWNRHFFTALYGVLENILK
ncbi:uncharacterized protein LOC144166352 [Haemaphysalis longicornis]